MDKAMRALARSLVASGIPKVDVAAMLLISKQALEEALRMDKDERKEDT